MEDEAVVAVRKDSDRPRKRFTKLELVSRFQQATELDYTMFQKDGLLENATIFEST